MRCIFLVLFTLLFSSGYGQERLNYPINFSQAVKNGTRTSLDGSPGQNYWVNKAQYAIDIQLEPFSGRVTGSETILYDNNSPDTLTEIVVSLLQDVYKKGINQDFPLPDSMSTEGVSIGTVALNDHPVPDDQLQRIGTNMVVKLSQPILPNSSAKLSITWHYQAKEKLTWRAGNYGDGRHFVAYFYPKIAVYDDLDGWDRTDYLGLAEFYGMFADYEVRITVPKDFVVWATGELQNASEVLRPKFTKRLAQAKGSKKVVHIIDSTDVKVGDITLDQPWLTWHYKATKVPDFAFATNNKHLWDARIVEVDPVTKRTSFVSAAYAKESADFYGVADIAAKALSDFSTIMPGVPYPYPAMTVFNAPSGMEFPMMCNDASQKKLSYTMGLTYHEIAHTYFPFYMGTNERKYAWMDEGWATFLPSFFFKDYTPDFDYHASRVSRYLEVAGTEEEVPILSNSRDLHQRSVYRNASYNKPYLAYYFLYHHLGDKAFKQAMHGYIDRWNGKHPSPYDFFHTFNSLSGENLNWFWKNWFYEKNHADLSIPNISEQGIHLVNSGGLYLPVELEITLQSGETKTISKPMSWWKGHSERWLKIDGLSTSSIKKIVLGNSRIPDSNPDDNTRMAN